MPNLAPSMLWFVNNFFGNIMCKYKNICYVGFAFAFEYILANNFSFISLQNIYLDKSSTFLHGTKIVCNWFKHLICNKLQEMFNHTFSKDITFLENALLPKCIFLI